ncbi:MAG TPA: anhydro-N-acetylmuramic acid kinase [Flavobacterium sp.]|uniref:anhydro-N-acetylmuramic acid kinase n=1 Tax=unclassified Flavobacterium TaxID=196869 RepID=UPI000E949B61|nr:MULTISPECIES: anhydro-N-acetylmuramic acid kinase [unclassified Flavobacterium]HBI00012.1 anhydro-N-acetylmuramic acid kinase [Flavobacterium sp.]HRE78230.1 anhydro-N-acetylmuramic acid kinase [Flavobacterium sp.]
MFKESYQVVGVMSGTSLDGIDLAHLHFWEKDRKWSYEILESVTISYPNHWLNKLKVAVHFSENELIQLNEEYTDFLGNIINYFLKEYKIDAIDAVCSHGHTILHQPQNGITLQIGNLPKLAEIIGKTVVCDFRVQDVELGGQGAPLVPIGDRLLFSDYDFCLNLGGFSNISFEENGKRIAFDISPVNTVLNFYANQIGLNYDDKGEIARSGKVNSDLLTELNNLDFYQKKYPKSLGIEFVNATILPLINNYSISIEDKLHTFVEHIATQIALALTKKEGKILITGGGAYHLFLLERMQNYLPKMNLIVPNTKTLEFKEALIFGLLGVLKLRSEINVLCSVTGAKNDHSSGKIFN